MLGRQEGLHCVCRASGMLERTVDAGDAVLAAGLRTIPATRPTPGTDMPLTLLYPWNQEENDADDATAVRFTVPNHSNHCKASVHCTASTRTGGAHAAGRHEQALSKARRRAVNYIAGCVYCGATAIKHFQEQDACFCGAVPAKYPRPPGGAPRSLR